MASKTPKNLAAAENWIEKYKEIGLKNLNATQKEKFENAIEVRKEAPRGADAPSSVKAATPKQKTKGNVFAGTNIPLSAIKDLDQREEFQRRLAADIADGNDRGANDVIFGIAYAAGGNKGHGNPNVGAVQSGVWKLDDGPVWAETSINSSNDVYRLRDEQGNLTGERVEYSDQYGVLKGEGATNPVGESGLLGADDAIDSWGQNAKAGIQGGQPTFKPSTGTQSIWTSYGDDPGWQAYFTSDPSKGPANIQTPKPDQPTSTGGTGDFTSGEKFTSTGTSTAGTGTGTGSMDLLAYRPGTADYWQKYMGPKMTDSLMKFQMPKITTGGLSYLPGEFRDPGQWANFLGMGGTVRNPRTGEVTVSKGRGPDKQFQGMIPQGTWRFGEGSYPTAGQQWQFTSPRAASMVAQTPWTAPNLTPAAAGQWSGLLGDWAAPALNTTNLLGVA